MKIFKWNKKWLIVPLGLSLFFVLPFFNFKVLAQTTTPWTIEKDAADAYKLKFYQGDKAASILTLDQTLSRVGIGIANPTQKLQVAGNIELGRNKLHFNGDTGTVATASDAGFYWHALGSDAGADYAIYRTPGAWTANTYQQLKLDWPTGIILEPGTGNNLGYDKSYVEITGGKGLRVTQGNVGIGTANPVTALDINGSGKSSGFVATGYNTTGWSGAGAEVGVVDVRAFFTGYNRSTGTYVDTYIRGSNIYLQNNGVTHATLDTNGNFKVTGCVIGGTAPLGTCASDIQLKKNINPLNVGLKQILGLNPVTYQYNGLGETIADGSIQNGLIAQDVEKVAPELVGSTSVRLHPNDAATTQVKTVNYGALNFAYINAIKEQQKQIESLSEIVNKQQTEINNLKIRIDSLVN